jgi:mono/diheme cytochrome c family protein
MKRIFLGIIFFVTTAIAGLAVYGYFLGDAQTVETVGAQLGQNSSDTISRGAYLVVAGNCMACHTTRGGQAYAGGRVLQSEFGNFITPNITPDAANGIGLWRADDFWAALHNGKSKDGRLLYPAFPYPNYTHVTRADSDAMFAYLKTVAPAQRKNAPHDLRFPYNQRALLVFWRALYFRPALYLADSQKSALWNRGDYLVNGLAHCSACHSSRNAVGANGGSRDLSGGDMAMVNWFAPSLLPIQNPGMARWSARHLQNFLHTGTSASAAALGPMADVVAGSLQYLSDTDIQAMVAYLQALPEVAVKSEDFLDEVIAQQQVGKQRMAWIMQEGEQLYKKHCSDCHAVDGSGVTSIYPALKGRQALLGPSVANPLRVILAGGFPPATKGNPRPYGMPPFGPSLSDSEIAIVLSYIRNAWGNHAAVVSSAEVNRYRTAPLD